MRYKASHLRHLQFELTKRYDTLWAAVKGSLNKFSIEKITTVNGTEIRLAVDDFKSLLTEIRRLK